MKIAIYTSHLSLPTFIELLGKKLEDRGHKVVFVGHDERFQSFKEDDVKYHPIPNYEDSFKIVLKTCHLASLLLLRKPNSFLKAIRILNQKHKHLVEEFGIKNTLIHFIRLLILKLEQVDLVHNQWTSHLNHLDLILNEYPVVQSFHARFEDINVWESQKLKNDFIAYLPKVKGIQSASNHSIQNASYFSELTANQFTSYSLVEQKWVDKNYEKKHILRKKQSKDQTLNIISVGKFAWRKGFHYAIDAMSDLKIAGTKFRYTIIGWGDCEDLQFQIRDLDLEGNVFLQSYLPQDRVIQCIAESDVFLLSSVQEGFPTVLTEAMAVGTPTITTNCGGIPEILKHGENCLLVKKREPASITSAIMELLAMKETEVSSLVSNAKKLAENSLTWEKNIIKYEELYSNALLKKT